MYLNNKKGIYRNDRNGIFFICYNIYKIKCRVYLK